VKRTRELAPDQVAEDVLAEVLAANSVQGAVLARSELAAPWGLRFPAMSRAGFHLLAEGSGWLRMKGLDEPQRLEAGDLVLLPHGSEHVVASTPRGAALPFKEMLARADTVRRAGLIRAGGNGPRATLVCGNYFFDRDEPHPILAQLPAVITVRRDDATFGAAIDNVVRLLMAELDLGHDGASAVAGRLIDVLFVLIVREFIHARNESEGGWLGALRDARVGRVLSHMHRDPSRRWTVDELAELAAMSPAAFKRRFTRLVGQAPLGYLTRIRMDVAARMLRSSDASLSEVATAIGYDSPYAFGRAFKRERGVAPGQYRVG
jgi:AraC-like DNA-binding protein